MLSSVKTALEQIKAGGFVIILDDKSRENEGDLVIAAKHINAEKLNFLLEKGKGLICTPMSKTRAMELSLVDMVKANNSKHQTAFTISIDIDNGSSGISAKDRALTISALDNPNFKAEHFVRPGHIFPLVANKDGVLGRNGHTEASLDLIKIAKAGDVAVICEILNKDGEIATETEIFALATEYQIPVITIDQLICHRIMSEQVLEYAGDFELQTDLYGKLVINVARDLEGREHVIVKTLKQTANPIVRIHSECFTGDILSSSHCDCGEQLHRSMEMIAQEGGVVIYMRQEGRGIGLFNKIRAYQLQKSGHNTFEANKALGFQEDERKYFLAARMLKDAGITNVRLVTNNPQKISQLEDSGINVVDRISIETDIHEFNKEYLAAKQIFHGHFINSNVIQQ